MEGVAGWGVGGEENDGEPSCSVDPSPLSAATPPPIAASSVKPPTKTASRRNSACSASVEQVVAPGDRVAQRRWRAGGRARRRSAAAAAAPAAPAAPPAGAASSGPRPARWPAAARRDGADFGDGGGILGGQGKVGSHRARPARRTARPPAIGRQRPPASGVDPPVGQRQRRHRVLVLAAEAQRRAAGDQHLDSRGQAASSRRRSGAAASRCSKLSSTSSIRSAAGRRSSVSAQRRPGDLAQHRAPRRSWAARAPDRGAAARSTKNDAVRESRRSARRPTPQGEPGLAGSARAGQRHQTDVRRPAAPQPRPRSLTSRNAVDEGGKSDAVLVGSRGSERMSAGRLGIRQRPRRRAPLVQIAEPYARPSPRRLTLRGADRPRELPHGLGEEDLAAVAGTEQPGQPVERRRRDSRHARPAARRRAAPCAPARTDRSARLGEERPLGSEGGGEAAGAVGNAAWTASPTVLKWTPPWAGMAVSRSARWRATAAAIACRSRSQSAVLPSISVKRKVTVPLGRSGIVLPSVPVAGGAAGIVACGCKLSSDGG